MMLRQNPKRKSPRNHDIISSESEVDTMEELLKIVLIGLACPLLLPLVIDNESEEVSEE